MPELSSYEVLSNELAQMQESFKKNIQTLEDIAEIKVGVDDVVATYQQAKRLLEEQEKAFKSLQQASDTTLRELQEQSKQQIVFLQELEASQAQLWQAYTKKFQQADVVLWTTIKGEISELNNQVDSHLKAHQAHVNKMLQEQASEYQQFHQSLQTTQAAQHDLWHGLRSADERISKRKHEIIGLRKAVVVSIVLNAFLCGYLLIPFIIRLFS